VRRQSEAATALWLFSPNTIQAGVVLRLASRMNAASPSSGLLDGSTAMLGFSIAQFELVSQY